MSPFARDGLGSTLASLPVRHLFVKPVALAEGEAAGVCGGLRTDGGAAAEGVPAATAVAVPPSECQLASRGGAVFVDFAV